MKRFIYTLALITVLLSFSGCNKYETVPGDPLNTKIYTLKNGLKVFMSVNKETPRIQTYIAVHVGGKNDPAETTGLAHYFEHLMFKGTQQYGTSDYEKEKPLLDKIEELFEVYRKTTDESERTAIYHQIDSLSFEASKISIPNEYDKLMAVIGAKGTNAWTSKDETVYTEDIPSNQIENWARIQADRFKNIVIRGFHTELETIYEEKNMSLTKDARKVYEKIDELLFPHHPYGKQSILGTQQHLKNPSITNVKNYHDQYYVPNNVAICLSGDFDPDQMVAVIEKYFGDWQANPNIPQLSYEKEDSIKSPISCDVYGLEAENVLVGWPYPGASDTKTANIATMASQILYNGTAGLIDLDVNQKQRALGMYGFCYDQPDYSKMIMMGMPKEGQTLEELRDIILEEVAKLRKGEFDENLLEATVNNLEKEKQQQLEKNDNRAHFFVNAFINNVSWKDYVDQWNSFDKVTKQDIIDFANQYLTENGYAVIYKRQGADTTIQKVTAPKITPIQTNRDMQSKFLAEIQKTEVKPIEPIFVDFSKDMSQADITEGIHLLYKQNEINDLFKLQFTFNTGYADDATLSPASDYITYLGTADKTAEQISNQLYKLACDYSVNTQATKTTITITGLSKNMVEALKVIEDRLLHAKADEQILQNVKNDIFKARTVAKANQSACYRSLRDYVYYGADFVKCTTLPSDTIAALTSDELISRISSLFNCQHEISYYGPLSLDEASKTIKENHFIASQLTPLPEHFIKQLPTSESQVIMAPYDSKQLYYNQYSNRGEKFDISISPVTRLYNEYFGGSMNSICFQEMREARGLAYSANANLYAPSFTDDAYTFEAFIATQNDKMQQAIEAFDDIINNMPKSEAAFKVAKDALIATMRTSRTTGDAVLQKFIACRRLGLDKPTDQAVFETIQNMTLNDITAFQEKWIKNRPYVYAILGDIKNLDTKYLSTLGPVKEVTLEDIFGF